MYKVASFDVDGVVVKYKEFFQQLFFGKCIRICREKKGKPMSIYKVASFDVDGVVAEYKEFIDDYHIGPPVYGMKGILQELIDDGWKVILFSTRGTEIIKTWCAIYDVPYTWVNENPEFQGKNPGKPVAWFHVDDRAIHFDGDVAKLRENIKNFKVWSGKMREEA